MPIKIDKSEEKIIFRLRELPEEKKSEVLDFINFLRTSRIKEEKGDEFSYYLERLRKKIKEQGGLKLGNTKDEILQKLRETRKMVWKEKYENHFRHK